LNETSKLFERFCTTTDQIEARPRICKEQCRDLNSLRIEDGNIRQRNRRRAVEERELGRSLAALIRNDMQSASRQELGRHHAFQSEIARRLTGARNSACFLTFDEKTDSDRKLDEICNDSHELLDRAPPWMWSSRAGRFGPLIAESHSVAGSIPRDRVRTRYRPIDDRSFIASCCRRRPS
jgi:hypothetical protein